MRKQNEIKNRQMRRLAKKGVVTVLCASMMIGTLTGCGTDTATTTYETVADVATETASDYCESEPMVSEYYSESAEPEMATTNDIAQSQGMVESKYAESCDVAYINEYDDYDYYDEYYNSESYEKENENGFQIAAKEPLSTFSSSVDTASYANVRRMIEDGYSKDYIPAESVRPEEFINYFSYDLKRPSFAEKFGVTTEVSSCPWNENHQLMFVGVATPEIDLREAPRSNIVFLVDVSGSMSDDDKLPLLQKAFIQLTESLNDKDTVSIVTYASGVQTILDGESAKNKKKIVEAIDGLFAGGSTNGEGGIQMAYKLAEQNFIKNGNNRVILATDGDLNVGVSDPDGLEKLISKKKDSGIYLSVLGFGTGNLKDDNMERLANCGNGNYSYIDSMYEAKKVLVEELGSNLVTVADDVKFQVEFNPENVYGYRLIGYENRMLANEDFYDESVDAGEIGAGHQVVVLYEIIPQGSESSIELKYGDTKEKAPKKNSKYADEYATVKISYKNPGKSEANYVDYTVKTNSITKKPSDNLKFAGMAAEFAMILSDSEYLNDGTYDDIIDTYETLKETDEYKEEFYFLVRQMAKRDCY